MVTESFSCSGLLCVASASF